MNESQMLPLFLKSSKMLSFPPLSGSYSYRARQSVIWNVLENLSKYTTADCFQVKVRLAVIIFIAEVFTTFHKQGNVCFYCI